MKALENKPTLSEENSHDFFSSLLPETTFWLRPSIARSVVSLPQGGLTPHTLSELRQARASKAPPFSGEIRCWLQCAACSAALDE